MNIITMLLHYTTYLLIWTLFIVGCYFVYWIVRPKIHSLYWQLFRRDKEMPDFWHELQKWEAEERYGVRVFYGLIYWNLIAIMFMLIYQIKGLIALFAIICSIALHVVAYLYSRSERLYATQKLRRRNEQMAHFVVELEKHINKVEKTNKKKKAVVKQQVNIIGQGIW